MKRLPAKSYAPLFQPAGPTARSPTPLRVLRRGGVNCRIDEVLVYCVNDGAVMDAWGESQGIEGSMITFLGRPQCSPPPPPAGRRHAVAGRPRTQPLHAHYPCRICKLTQLKR